MAEEFLYLLLIEGLEDAEEREPRVYDRRRNPFEELTDRKFACMFRLSKDLARFLINVLTPYLTDSQRAQDLSVDTKVLICLRFYASGSYQMDIASNKLFCVTQPTVSRCVRTVTDALNQPAVFNRFVTFPRTLQELNNIRTGFFRRCQFPGIIGIIDCTHVAIVPPARNDPEHPEHIYVNRKHYHSLNVQLICDVNLKILNVNALYPGSTHDAFVWESSNVNPALHNLHAAGHVYYLLGDSGYPLRPWLLTRVDGEPLGNTPEGAFNQVFKQIRCTIERCNGVLKKRFRCLLKDRVLQYTPGTAGRIVNACVVLHNLCIDYNIPEVIDHDLPDNPDFGIYNPVNYNEDLANQPAARRVNPDLAKGRAVRTRLIRTLWNQRNRNP